MFLFRKLIIAVLALGLVLSFGSAAFAKTTPDGRVLNEVFKPNPNAPLAGQASEIPRNIPEFTKPVSEIELVTPSMSLRAPNSPCEDIDYSGGAAYYYWNLPNAYSTAEFSQRFTPAGACTLKSFAVAFDFSITTGSPDLELKIYGDDGFGYPDPGNVIHSQVIPNASLPTTATYLSVTGLNYTFADGEEFHIAWAPVINTPSDTLFGFSDDGSNGDMRSAEFWSGAWGFMADNWGIDVNFLMGASVCYETQALPEDCYYQFHYGGVAFLWNIPTGNGHRYYAQQFKPEGPETLKTVEIPFYGAEHTAPNTRVLVCGTDAGAPDTTNIFFETTLAIGDLTFFPGFTVIDVSGLGLVFEEPFFVAVDNPDPGAGVVSVLSSDGSDAVSYGYLDFGGAWYQLGGLYGLPGGAAANFVYDVYMCRDVFAECKWETYWGGFAYFVQLPDSYDQTAWGVRISSSFGGCYIDFVDVYMYDAGTPVNQYDAEVAIYAADGPSGLPGTKLTYAPVPAGTFGFGWNSVPIGGTFFYEEDVWVVVESFAPAASGDLTFIIDDGSTPTGRSASGLADGSWLYTPDFWGGSDYDPVIDTWVCCLPLEDRTCAPGEEWPTMGKTFARENASLNGIGGINTADDARCYLTKDWDYVGPNWAQYNSPVISDGLMVVTMTDHIVCIDASTGAEQWVVPADNIYLGGSQRCTPTIHNGYVYVGGGDAQGFNCLDLNTGAVVWQRFNNAFNVYAPSVIINVGGTDVVYFSDDFGSIYAYDAVAGTDFYGSNPFFTATGLVHKAFTTDGTYLYVGCDNFSGQPNLFKIDAATGTVAADFVSGPDGFQLPVLHPGEPDAEGIFHSMAYEDGFLYMATSYSPQPFSPVTNGGLMYKINTSDLSVEWVAEANGASTGDPGGVILDAGQVIFGGFSNWVDAGDLWGPTSYGKGTGGINWTQTVTNPTINQHAGQAGVLTCEDTLDAAVPDWLIWGDIDWYWHFLEATAGEQVFHRRMFGSTAFINSPIVNDEYLYITSLDFIAALKNQATERPRLELPENMEVRVSVEFGLPASVDITFPDVITNTGCADLTVNSVTLDSQDNGTFPLSAVSSVNPRRNAELSDMANQMTGKGVEFIRAMTDEMIAETITKEKASSMDRASFAPPSWINGVTAPAPGAIVPAGASADVVVNIDGTALPRGYNPFYAFIDTDDPDYFLDYAYIDNPADYGIPSVKLAVVGGCLLDDALLSFGIGGANQANTYNTTKIFRDNTVDPGWIIDGDNAAMYGADGYVFGWQDKYHTVMNWDDPFSNVEFTYNSILADPYVDQDCNFISGTALLARMSTDGGATYTDIYGTILNYAYVDSVQDLRLGGEADTTFDTWDWEYGWHPNGGEPTYNDSLTEGYAFRGLVAEYGVVDVPEFNNFIVTRHSVYSRYGYAIDDMYISCYIDYDVGDYTLNRGGYSSKYSTAFMYDRTVSTDGWGAVKVPFGPGFETMKNAVATTYGTWLQDPQPNFDSIIVWMENLNGFLQLYADDDDRRLFFTLGELDLPAWDYVPTADKDDIPDSAFAEIGAAMFGLNDLTDPTDEEEYGPLATFANKFCGFGRGDVNNDGTMNLIDIVYLNSYEFHGGNGPFPFEHLGDVDGDGNININDILYMIDWYFYGGPAPVGDWALPRTTLP